MSSVPSAVCVVDTNVVVSGLIGAAKESPAVFVLDAMLGGGLAYLLSQELLNEYSTVLRRANLMRLHGLSGEDIDRLLTHLVVLITGDRLLLEEPPAPGSVISPRHFRDLQLPGKQ